MPLRWLISGNQRFSTDMSHYFFYLRAGPNLSVAERRRAITTCEQSRLLSWLRALVDLLTNLTTTSCLDNLRGVAEIEQFIRVAVHFTTW